MPPFDRTLRFLTLAAPVAAALSVAAVTPATAAPPLIVQDPARPSAIAVIEGSAYLQLDPHPEHVVCIVFVNHGPHTATKVGLNLAMVDATGTVLGVDVMYPTGKFFIDARSAFSGAWLSPSNHNCHTLLAAHEDRVHGSALTFHARRGAPAIEVAAIVVSAREIVYDDGTAWRTDQIPQPGDHIAPPMVPPFVAAVADGPPRITPSASAGSPVEITDAYAVETAGVETNGKISDYVRKRATCIALINHDPRPARTVRVALALVDRTGTIAGIEEILAHGTFSRDVPIDTLSDGLCTFVPGRLDAETFVYEPQGPLARQRTSVRVGRILAIPVQVDFHDRTVWKMPNPPKIGDPITGP